MALTGIAFHDVMREPMRRMPGPGALELERLMTAVAEDRDRDAFAALFSHFAPRLKAFLMRLGSGGVEAEELMQEAMLMVWRRAESFDSRQAGVSTWVFTIARNKRIDALRRERRPEFDPEDPALIPAPPPAADDEFAAREDSARLRKAIAALPAEQAALIRMAYFEDKAHVAIAEETELPLGTVKSRLRLALGRLRKALKETA